MGANPTISTERVEAEAEGLEARRDAGWRRNVRRSPADAMRSAARVALLDLEGRVLFESELS
jgi:hypothetical protein